MGLNDLINKYVEFIYKGDYTSKKLLEIVLLCNAYSKIAIQGSALEINILRSMYSSLKHKYELTRE